jgi:AmiR/NasT family two-component response regulator
VIEVLETDDHDFVTEAARRGVFAYITSAEANELQDSLAIVLCRFAEFQNLEGAFGRRGLIQRAKRILMVRHAIDENHAFEMLRAHARSTNRKLTTIADAVVDGHRLLPRDPDAADPTG